MHEHTYTWPSGTRKIVLRNIPDAINTVAMRETKDGGNTFTRGLDPACHFVISYYYPQKVFIIWNASVHRQIHNPKSMTTVSIGEENKGLLNASFNTGCINPVFKPIRQEGIKDCVELVVIVGENALYNFCKTYEEYLIPNINEIPMGKHCLYAVPGGELHKISRHDDENYQFIERERERVYRAKRDPHFRDKVIEKWGGRCIVCGANEVRILEAAHIESVSKGGSDNPENGYCLCANHHRMYDQGIIDIDVSRNTFQCHSKDAKNMPWYFEAVKRNYQLYLPAD